MTTKPASPAQKVRKLTKGEMLFSEGEKSRAMYFLKTGMIRIFKQKADAFIEIDTIRAGSVIGELAFLDGNPRSASGEALTACELVEIGGDTFTATLAGQPEWLKILLKTVVGRLRAASTRIRQLEQASTAVDYSDKEGRRNYVFLSPHDVLKALTTLLLVSSRYGESTEKGPKVHVGALEKFGTQAIGLPLAKISTVCDLLVQTGRAAGEDVAGAGQYLITDLPWVEGFLQYLIEENLAEPSKRHDLNLKSFQIMHLIHKYWGDFKVDPKSGQTLANLAHILKSEAAQGAREPFRPDELEQLVAMGYVSSPRALDTENLFVEAHPEKFPKAYGFQQMIHAIGQVNSARRAK